MITIIADNYPSKGRPVFVFVQQLVWALVDMGVDVSVVAQQSLTHALFRGDKLLPKKNVDTTSAGNKYDVYRPYSLSFGNGFPLLYKLFEKFNKHNLYKTINKINPDILYGHFWHSANKVAQYASEKNIPVFVACGEGDNALENLVAKSPKKQLELLKSVVKGVISVSSENKRKCIEFGLKNYEDIIVLPNCVDDSIFHPASNKSLREKLGVTDEDFLIMFVGGFIHRKGTNRLSNAIDKLNDEHIKVAFIGKPMGGDTVMPSCKNIVFQGALDHDQLVDYYHAADLFVLPTLKEGCSNAIVEALACGVPVVSSNRPFNADILNDGNAILVDPDNVDEIANAIYQMKNDKTLYDSKKQFTIAHSGEHSIIERAKNIYTFIENKIAER